MPNTMGLTTATKSHQHDPYPLVSVIALCFNHRAFVIETLESIRCQTYRNIQLIIFDDCSSDDSVHLIKEWIEKHQIPCLFIAHDHNQGLIKTINEGIALAQGKYTACVSTDDVWLLDKLEYQISQMEKLPEDYGVIYSDAYRIDPKSNKLDKLFIETCNRNFSSIPTGYIFPDLLRSNFICAPTALVRRSCYDKVGFYDESLCYEDWDMWLRIASHYQFFFSDIVTVNYRIVPTSLTQRLFNSKNLSVSLADFNMFMKYYDHPIVLTYHKQQFANKLTSLAYDLNDLRFKKRSLCLYKAWKYDFRKKTFILWILASLKIIPQSLEQKVSYFLDNPSHHTHSFLHLLIGYFPQALQQKLRTIFKKIKKWMK